MSQLPYLPAVRTAYGATRGRRYLACTAVLAAAALLASCSSSGSGPKSSDSAAGPSTNGTSASTSSNSAVATSAAAFATAQQPISGFTAPGPKIDATKLAGKTVWYIPLDYSDSFFHIVAGQLKPALATANVNLNICDGKGNPTDITRCMQQAIGARASVIIADGPGPSVIGSQMKQAKAAGIPVIEGDILDPDSPVPDGAAAVVANAASDEGKVFGNAVVALSHGKANILGVSTLEVQQGKLMLDAAIGALKASCATCSSTVLNVPIAQWSTQLQADVRAQLVAHPDINYIVVAFDSMTPFILPALAGKNIPIITQNANLPEMKDMAAGNHVVVDVGSDMGWQAWAYADQAFRLMTGNQPVVENIPIRAFTPSNVKALELTLTAAASQDWYGAPSLNQEMENGFKSLWGLGG